MAMMAMGGVFGEAVPSSLQEEPAGTNLVEQAREWIGASAFAELQTAYLARGKVLEFSGDEEIVSRGLGRDLNLMLNGVHGSMRIVYSGEAAFTPHAFLFLYCPEETDVSGTLFPADSFLRLYPNGEKILSVSKPSVLFTIDL